MFKNLLLWLVLGSLLASILSHMVFLIINFKLTKN